MIRNSDIIAMQVFQFKEANCLSVDPEVFFADGKESENKEQVKMAKRVCGNCTVRKECLKFAIDNQCLYGVYGGLTGLERRRLARRKSQAPLNPTTEDVLFLKTLGYNNETIAERMGISTSTVEMALIRHKRNQAKAS